MKLSDWAKQQGISYKTAWRWFREDKLPVPAEQTATGTIIVKAPIQEEEDNCVVYARVSSHSQLNILDRQVTRVVQAVNAQGLKVSKVITEIGAGLNGRRPHLIKLLANDQVRCIAVERRDRLMRVGTNYIESVLNAQGRKLIVVDKTESKEDLVEDVTDVLLSLCTKLYGKRGAKDKIEKILQIINHADTHST